MWLTVYDQPLSSCTASVAMEPAQMIWVRANALHIALQRQVTLKTRARLKSECSLLVPGRHRFKSRVDCNPRLAAKSSTVFIYHSTVTLTFHAALTAPSPARGPSLRVVPSRCVPRRPQASSTPARRTCTSRRLAASTLMTYPVGWLPAAADRGKLPQLHMSPCALVPVVPPVTLCAPCGHVRCAPPSLRQGPGLASRPRPVSR